MENGWLELNASRDAMTLKPIAKAQEVIIVIGEQLNRAAIEAHWKRGLKQLNLLNESQMQEKEKG